MTKRLLIYLTLLYSVTAGAVLTLPDKAELGLPFNYILNGGFERGAAGVSKYNDTLSVTITTATPAVFTTAAPHLLVLGDGVVVQSTATLPTGLASNVIYYVVSIPSATTFTVSTTRGGTAVATTAAGSGTYTASATRPIDAIAGTTTHLSFTTSPTAPLQGLRSLVVTNSGTTPATGEGFTLPITLDPVDRGVTMNVSFSYLVQSGTFNGGSINGGTVVDSDLEPFLYDVTNGQLLSLTPTLLQCAGIAVKCDFTGQFVAQGNTSNIRLAFHVPTANPLAWSVKFDGFNVSRVVRNGGFNAAEFRITGPTVVSATTTAPTKGTVLVDTIGYTRFGDSAHVIGSYKQSAAGASSGSGDYLYSLPAGLSFDPNKVPFYTAVIGANADNSPYSRGSVHSTIGTNLGQGTIIPYDATRFRIALIVSNQGTTANNGAIGGGFFGLAQSNYTLTFDFIAPIAGWSAGSSTSDQSPSVPVNFSVYRSTAYSLATSAGVLPFDQTIADTHAGVSAAGYTVKVPGLYHCDTKASITSSAANVQATTRLELDGVALCTQTSGTNANSAVGLPCSKDFQANANQVIRTTTLGGASLTGVAGIDQTYLTCHKTNQGLGITASDPLTATYFISTAQSVAAGGVIKYDTKSDDTLLSYNPVTGVFTCLQGGKFRASVTAQANASTGVYGLLNGTTRLGPAAVAIANQPPVSGFVAFRCTQGQTVTLNSEAAAQFAAPSATYGPVNSLTIERTGP